MQSECCQSECCQSVVFTCSFLSVFIFFVDLWRFWLVIGSSVLTNSSLMHVDDDLSIICHTHVNHLSHTMMTCQSSLTHVNHLLRTTMTCQLSLTHTSTTCHTWWWPVNHLSHTSIICHTRQRPVNHLPNRTTTCRSSVTHDKDLSIICHICQSPVNHSQHSRSSIQPPPQLLLLSLHFSNGNIMMECQASDWQKGDSSSIHWESWHDLQLARNTLLTRYGLVV